MPLILMTIFVTCFRKSRNSGWKVLRLLKIDSSTLLSSYVNIMEVVFDGSMDSICGTARIANGTSLPCLLASFSHFSTSSTLHFSFSQYSLAISALNLADKLSLLISILSVQFNTERKPSPISPIIAVPALGLISDNRMDLIPS